MLIVAWNLIKPQEVVFKGIHSAKLELHTGAHSSPGSLVVLKKYTGNTYWDSACVFFRESNSQRNGLTAMTQDYAEA